MDVDKLKEQFVEWYNKDKGSNTYWGMHIHIVKGRFCYMDYDNSKAVEAQKSFEIWKAAVLANPSIAMLQKKHSEWVTRMGWTDATVLESLALVVSEVGEAINECRGAQPTDNFKIELADICLRVFALAENQNIDIQKMIFVNNL